jgi:amino-acid N-acetyltransferase
MLREVGLSRMSRTAIRPAVVEDLSAVLGLLRSAFLPDDAEPHFANFFVAQCDGSVVGAIGFESLGDRALLRSLVVEKSYRATGIGTSLADEAIRHARRIAVAELFLLTTDAASFFERLGFERVPHAEAPAAVRQTRQFSELCPATAQLMRLVLS